ncbi:ATP-binding protein [Bacillus sp. FJAT-44742]|uniref:ATP-binding protein n=1 Tax=Bacillus sp. FJAT-44742 TaxID=2014005 RepID=UPI0018E2168C|nr:ATP-binding protein [Bacillus sp. FJAT-44742]
MLWRSVVGKLWLTILLLVSVVLLLLTVLLLQFFEGFHINEAEEQLTNHANVIASLMEEFDDDIEALETIEGIAASYETRLTIFEGTEHIWSSTAEDPYNVYLPSDIFLENEILSRVITENESVVTHGDFPVYENGEEIHNEIFVVGIPLEMGEDDGALFLYQSLAVIEDTTGVTRQIILLSAGIAIILTTIFAFFLSSRITAPLRKMRQVTLEVAEGKFDTKVPTLTNDEIGQLANAFNRMRRELNRSVTQVNQEKEQLSRVLSSMADGVVTIDRKGSILITNPPADRFLQAYYYEMGGELTLEKLPKDMKKLFQQVVAIEREQVTEIDLQGRHYAIIMTPLYDGTFVRGVVVLIRDMTEEKQHDKLRKDFIANVSHELRTPISMLQGYSEAIIDDIAATDEEKKELGQIIYEESLRMGRLVNELLDIARMEAGHIQLNKEPIQIHEMSAKITRKFHGLAKEAGVNLQTEVTGEEPVMDVDPDRYEQVLTNLIHNAIRHTEAGGTVTLRVETDQSGVSVDVEDTGSGIPEEDLPFVFERFYKADKARTRGRSGTGLGLAIAKNIVEGHNGQISAHSKVEEGTTFTFHIPREDVQ